MIIGPKLVMMCNLLSFDIHQLDHIESHQYVPYTMTTMKTDDSIEYHEKLWMDIFKTEYNNLDK